jgi:translation initiation factor 3 subunit D
MTEESETDLGVDYNSGGSDDESHDPEIESEDGKLRFHPPLIVDNPEGWGPCGEPEQFEGLPFQPFSKADKIGKVADWTGTLYTDRRYGGRWGQQYNQMQGGLTSANQYAYYHEAEDSTFQLVDTTRTVKPMQQRAARQRQLQIQRKLAAQKERERRIAMVNMNLGGRAARSREKDRQKAFKRWQKQFGNRQKFDNRGPQAKLRQSSVQIKPDWEVIEEMDFPRLQKLSLPNVGEGDDIERYGSMEYFDKTYDRVTSRSEKPLIKVQRDYYSVTTTEDPVIQKLSKSAQYTVFATDAVLATLMCSTRSVYSWDLVVHRVGKKLFFDKRDVSDFDLLTVSETAVDTPQDEDRSMNSAKNLGIEATYINKNFCQQVLKIGEERYNFENANPFADDDVDIGLVASVGYRYRVWDLGNQIQLVVRTEHDGVVLGPNGETQFLTVKAFNEWDAKQSGGVDWRSKIDNQRGAVLATELRNNSNKLAKWTVQALLAGSDYIKFGYVSRQHVRDSAHHVILGTQQFKPNELANQITLSMDNAWGILRCIIDMCMKEQPGKYLIMKDPNKPVIRLYRVPMNAFEDDDEDDRIEEAD